MGRKIGALLTNLKEKAGMWERQAKRMEALLADKTKELNECRGELARLKARKEVSQPNK